MNPSTTWRIGTPTTTSHGDVCELTKRTDLYTVVKQDKLAAAGAGTRAGAQ